MRAIARNCAQMLCTGPMDTQLLSFQIQSYELTTDIFKINWQQPFPVKYSTDTGDKLPEFIVDSDESVNTLNCDITYTTTGTHSCLEVRFKVKRQVGFYLVQIYFPSLLLINLSWFSFWIDPLNSPARVGIGIFVVLNLLTMWVQENSNLPQVSYIKFLEVLKLKIL